MTTDKPGWRPIESADKEAASLILANNQTSGEGHFEAYSGVWVWVTGCEIVPPPTHWQPLPLPPAPGGEND